MARVRRTGHDRIRDAAHSHLSGAGKPEAYRQAIFDGLYARCAKRWMCPKTISS